MRNIHYTIITLYNYQYYRIWKFYMNIMWIYTTTKKYICNIYIYIYTFSTIHVPKKCIQIYWKYQIYKNLVVLLIIILSFCTIHTLKKCLLMQINIVIGVLEISSV